MKKLKLHTTHDMYHTLSTLAMNARDKSESVRVPLEALKALVMDHSGMVDRLKEEQLEGDI